MPDKLEVLAGPGLVARFGELTVWAGTQASPALQAHLVNEARRLSQSPQPGDQLANSFIAVLQRGDPEPQAPFAVVGPGANGLTLFLHGPVQAWDSGRWLAPQPVPGWMVTSIGRPWPLIVLPYGAAPPPQSPPNNPFDLLQGTVPGTGFVMLRPAGQPAANQAVVGAQQTGAPGMGGPPAGYGQGYAPGGPGQQFPGAAPAPGGVALGPSGPPTGPGPNPAFGGGLAGGGPAAPYVPPGQIGPAVPDGARLPTAQPETGAQTAPGTLSQAPAGLSAPPAAPATAQPATPADLVDLQVPPATPLAPLPVGTGTTTGPDAQQVVGLRCEQGHLNHPRASSCAHCGRPLWTGQAPASGPRPALGVLLADDGSVWSLDRPCLIGTSPQDAPEVVSGAAQAIAMRAGNNHVMAPVHAEVQLRDWNVYLVDLGAEGGTCVQGPGAQGWTVLNRHEQRELSSGSHLSCGGRVLTFLSAWPA